MSLHRVQVLQVSASVNGLVYAQDQIVSDALGRPQMIVTLGWCGLVEEFVSGLGAKGFDLNGVTLKLDSRIAFLSDEEVE